MQTELAQIISLTSYGNGFLKTGEVSENYFPGNTVFQHCNSIDFRDFKKSFLSAKHKEKVIAENPIDWFKLLKNEGCSRFRLFYKPADKNEFGPEYNLAGFVGGAGTWLIETCFNNYSHYWQKRWQVSNKEASDNKIWSVNYVKKLKKFGSTNQQADIEKTKEQFATTVKTLIDFCRQNDLKDWLITFERSYDALLNPQPNKLYYHSDLIILKNYSLSAQQLLFGASLAWVFGGMGWWNDMGFTDKAIHEKYLELSQQLYEQLLQSIIATTNSF